MENMMNSDHKATNKNYRDNYDRIFSGNHGKDCTCRKCKAAKKRNNLWAAPWCR